MKANKPLKTFFWILCLGFLNIAVTRAQELEHIKQKTVEKLLRKLSADEMRGRDPMSPAIEKAIKLIEKEFKSAGLKPFKGTNFRQNFTLTRLSPVGVNVTINGVSIHREDIFSTMEDENIVWRDLSECDVIKLGEQGSFFNIFRQATNPYRTKPYLVLINPAHEPFFRKMQTKFSRTRDIYTPNEYGKAIFVLTEDSLRTFDVTIKNRLEKKSLTNVVGILPGKTKSYEYVMFSAHYDHLGIKPAENKDSIANGADDDASGCVAVMSLANYFKKTNQHERSLIFAAFTAEEIGGMGSEYMSQQISPDSLIAMINIEMIGKKSKFGESTSFITGYSKSSLGKILQKNLEDSEYQIHPDPYIAQNLFFRSDNKAFAYLGVPAHSISSSQIDADTLYHSVDDEANTLDFLNMTNIIKSIAQASSSLVDGTDTPTRIDLSND